MQSIINNQLITLLSIETSYISGLTSLEQLQTVVQEVYMSAKANHASKEVLQLVEGLGSKYEIVADVSL